MLTMDTGLLVWLHTERGQLKTSRSRSCLPTRHGVGTSSLRVYPSTARALGFSLHELPKCWLQTNRTCGLRTDGGNRGLQVRTSEAVRGKKAPGRCQAPETPKVWGKGRAKYCKTLQTGKERSISCFSASIRSRAITNKKTPRYCIVHEKWLSAWAAICPTNPWRIHSIWWTFEQSPKEECAPRRKYLLPNWDLRTQRSSDAIAYTKGAEITGGWH